MIQPTSNSIGSQRTTALTPSSSHAAPAKKIESPSADSLSTSNAEALKQALASSPEIRPEVVARGRELAADPTYPPRQIIEQLAKMFTAASDPSDLA